jgi:hypothetical protein
MAFVIHSLPDDLLVKLATANLFVWNKLVETVPFFGRLLNDVEWVQRHFAISVRLVDNTTPRADSGFYIYIRKRLIVYLNGTIVGKIDINAMAYHSYHYECKNADFFNYDKSLIVVTLVKGSTTTYRYDIHGKLHYIDGPAIDIAGSGLHFLHGKLQRLLTVG